MPFKPYNHQTAANKASTLRNSNRAEFFAYLMGRGTGKTKVAIDEATQLWEDSQAVTGALIIAPNDVHTRWVTEQIPLHIKENIPYKAVAWENQKSKKGIKELQSLFEFPDHLCFLSMNIETFQNPRGRGFTLAENFVDHHKTIIVLDESTRIKTPGSKRSKALVKLARNALYRRIMTGNEITKSPFDVYMQYKFLNYDFWDVPFYIFKHKYGEFKKQRALTKQLKSYKNCFSCNSSVRPKVIRFRNRISDNWDVKFTCPSCNQRIKFNAKNNDKTTREAVKVKDAQGTYEFETVTGYKNLDHLKKKIMSCSYRVKKRDCLDLPPKIYEPLYAQMNVDQKRLYKELKENLFAEYENQPLTILNKISLRVRFRQIVGGFFPTDEEIDHPNAGLLIGKSSPKMDRLLYDLEDVDAEAIIIWAVFKSEIKHIEEILLTSKAYRQDRTVTFFGETKKSTRTNIISDFQQGKIRFLVANPASAGTGLNLQRSTLHYYYSNSEHSENRWQSEDRSHRAGQTQSVIYKDILIKNTTDIAIQKNLQKKLDMAEFFKRPLEEMI